MPPVEKQYLNQYRSMWVPGTKGANILHSIHPISEGLPVQHMQTETMKFLPIHQHHHPPSHNLKRTRLHTPDNIVIDTAKKGNIWYHVLYKDNVNNAASLQYQKMKSRNHLNTKIYFRRERQDREKRSLKYSFEKQIIQTKANSHR